MDLALVLEKTKANGVHRGIAPPFIEESAGIVKVREVLFICLAPEKRQVANLKIGPEVARRIPSCSPVMLRPLLTVRQPVHRIVRVNVLGMRGNKLLRGLP